MQPARSLLISSDFPPVPGGQSRYLYGLWSCWPPDAVQVLAPALPGADEVDRNLSVPVERIFLPLGGGAASKLVKPLLLAVAVRRLRAAGGLQSCHCGQLLSAGSVGWWLWRRYAVPYYVYVYGADVLEFQRSRFWRRWLHTILLHARRVVAVSTFTATLVRRLGVPPERVIVVHPGVDVDLFARPQDRNALRKARGWEGRQVLLSVGRLVQRKGHDVVLEALSDVLRSVPDVLYCIAGEGPYRGELESRVRRLGLDEHVRFLGFVPDEDLPSLYAAADVFTMVSRELPESGDVEGFGIVYLEAAAAGLVAVAGRSGGVEDAVSHGETGLLVDPRDPGAVGAALSRVLCDGDLRRRMGDAAKARVRACFDRETQADRLWKMCT